MAIICGIGKNKAGKLYSKLNKMENGRGMPEVRDIRQHLNPKAVKRILASQGKIQKDVAEGTGIKFNRFRHMLRADGYGVKPEEVELIADYLGVPEEMLILNTKDAIRDAMETVFHDSVYEYHAAPDTYTRKQLLDATRMIAPYYVPNVGQYLQAQQMIAKQDKSSAKFRKEVEGQMKELGFPTRPVAEDDDNTNKEAIEKDGEYEKRISD